MEYLGSKIPKELKEQLYADVRNQNIGLQFKRLIQGCYTMPVSIVKFNGKLDRVTFHHTKEVWMPDIEDGVVKMVLMNGEGYLEYTVNEFINKYGST